MPGINNNWKYGLAWSPKLETGYAEIDNQHKNLFKLTSDLIESCGSGNKISIDETLNFLVDYTVRHFADEEQIAIKYNYPQREEHKKMHDDFKNTVGGFVKKYEKDGDSEALFSAVSKVIARWLVNHINGEDSKIARNIREVNAKKS